MDNTNGCPPPPECIEDGRNGFMHPPRVPGALVDVLAKIFAAPAAAWAPVAQAARETWRTRFSVERMVREFGRIYSENFGLQVY